MPSYPLRALVLRHTKLGETDVIVTLLAEDGRQVRAVAKGLRKPGSRIGGRLEEFAVADLLLHTGRSLDVVSEVRTHETHKGLRGDLDRSAAASVVVDLLDKASLEGQTDPRLFALSDATLTALECAEVRALPALVVAFLVKAMAMMGYRPELESCAACGSDAASSERFSVTSGGTLCPACGDVDPSALRCAPAALEWLLVLMRSTMAEVSVLDMPDAAVSDCFAIIRSFVVFHVPARLKALDFYASILPRS